MGDVKKENMPKMESKQEFCLRWNDHQSTLVATFEALLENDIFVDCTLAAEGQSLKAHKVVLSACSPYFQHLLTQHIDKHPIIILKDIKFIELKAMLDYMYRGEVNIPQEQLGPLLRAAESLQIRGLGGANNQKEAGSQEKEESVSPVSTSSHTSQTPCSDNLEEISNLKKSSAIKRGIESTALRKRMRHHDIYEDSMEQNIPEPQDMPCQSLLSSVCDVTIGPVPDAKSNSSSTIKRGEFSDIPNSNGPALSTTDNAVPARSSSFLEVGASSVFTEWNAENVKEDSEEPDHSPNMELKRRLQSAEVFVTPKAEYVDLADDSLTNSLLENVKESVPSCTDEHRNTAFVPWFESSSASAEESLGRDAAVAFRHTQVSEMVGFVPTEITGRRRGGKLRGSGPRRGRRITSGLFTKKRELMTEEEKERLRKYERERKRVQRAKKAAVARAEQTPQSHSSVWDCNLSSRRRSWTWKYFVEEPCNKVRCIMCSKELKYDATKNTSGMIRHLKTHDIVPVIQQLWRKS